MPKERDAHRVCILLGLRDGAANLPAQLQSYAAQSHAAWDLIVSDDGSADAGPDIVRRFAAQMRRTGQRVDLVAGRGTGFARNFLGLLAKVPAAARFAALSDQDDVWLDDKLARACAALADVPPATPALYCSRRWVWKPETRAKWLSQTVSRRPGFANALIENIAGGNTIVLNRAAVRLAQRAAPAADGIFAHDWWLYLLISGAGGDVIYDPAPTVLYRQHSGNILGAGERWRARLRQPFQVLAGRFAVRVAGNIAALEAAADCLTPEARAMLAAFKTARAAPLVPRLRGFRALGLYRQTARGRLGFWGAALLGRV